MRNFFIIALLTVSLTHTSADVSSLQDQNTNQDQLDPLHDHDQDLTSNNQDKRTICSAFHKCSGGSTGERGYIKHVLVKPSYILRPVGVRPVVIGGYRYPKPRIHFKLKAPSSHKPVFGGWTPVISGSKPTVQLVKPASHVNVVHSSPLPHVDHVATSPVHVPAPVHEHHVQPAPVHVRPAYVHQQPVAVADAHVDQVHQINVPHGSHYDTFTHIDHIHQAAVPVAQPVVPIAPPPTILKPFAPPPVLFEVTKPNLGVLPLGARFPSPILREVPHVHYKPVAPAIPVASVTPAFPVAPSPPVAPPLAPYPVFPHIVPQAGVSLEYHGTRNYLPYPGGVSLLHQQPEHHVHSVAPSGFGLPAAYPHQQLPFEHTHPSFLSQQQQSSHDHQYQGFLSPQQQQLPHDHQLQGFLSPQQQQLPHDHQQQGFLLPQQQQLPQNHQAQGFLSPQQLPHDHQAHFALEHQLPQQISPHFLQTAQQYQDIPQGQLPLEGEPNFDQFLGSNQESLSQNFAQSNVIQPGQTDLQIPYHLPQHPGWDGAAGIQQQTGVQEESRGFGDQVFRPSPQLEAPYQK